MSNIGLQNIKNNNRNKSWILLGVLVVFLFVSAVFFTLKINDLQKATADLNYIEYLSSTTQRLIKLTLENRDTQKLVFYLDDIIKTSFDYQHAKDVIVVNNEIMQNLVDNVITDWEIIKNIILQNETELDFDDLYFAGERHFFHATDLSLIANDHIQNLSTTIIITEFLILVNILIIGGIIATNLIQTHVELKLSKEYAKQSFFDTSTGLYNRSKCQELFKADISTRETHAHAIIVFDLNDLKKANDVHGHRVGDELIASFARLLMEAAKVHITEPFIGRYGGDEFIVFYSNADEEEVKLYLQELRYLTDEFNRTASKFQVSYAAGYALVLDKDSKVTVRQLFDKADEAMYANKKTIKNIIKDEMKNKSKGQ